MCSIRRRCQNYWCNTEFSKKWSGPGKEGYVINPDGTMRILDVSGEKSIGCKDKNANCGLWASWDSNECETNARYMTINCPSSCGLCKGGFASADEL